MDIVNAHLASMRPQHNTAEDADLPHMRPVDPPASMRPQHNTAEDYTDLPTAAYKFIASMRPQHNTAEDFLGRQKVAPADALQ